MSEPRADKPTLRELVAKWKKISDRYFNKYSNALAPADRRDFGMSDAYLDCADKLEQALAGEGERLSAEQLQRI